MITFKAKKVESVGYSKYITSNNGEEQLIIVTSWGQDFKTKLVIVSAQVDGGLNVLVNGGARLNLANVLTKVEDSVTKWCGLTRHSLDLEENTKQKKQIKKFMDSLVEEWGLAGGVVR